MSAQLTKRDYIEDCALIPVKSKDTIASPLKEEPSSHTTLKKVFDELFEEVKCALCLELFDKPVILHCLHTFCASCLKELVTSNNTISCPLCRTPIKLEDKGIAGLRTNYHLLNIVEKMRKASAKRCDECQVSYVTEHCKQCRAYLCPQCGIRIHSLRLLRDHVRHPVSPEDCVNNNNEELDIMPVMENPMQDDDIVVDFVIRRDACLDLFRAWESKLWFAPTDLKAATTIRQLKALFLPYWLFEVETCSRYAGMSAVNIGTGKHLSSWSPFAGSNTARHRYAVCASDCFEPGLVTKIEPWKLGEIRNAEFEEPETGGSSGSSQMGESSEGEVVSPEPQHSNCHPARSCSPVTRTQALAFVVDEMHAWNQGASASVGSNPDVKSEDSVENKIRVIDKEVCEEKLKERLGRVSVVKDLRVDTLITRVAAQRIFLPVYILRYVYSGHSYIVLVNGQTGQLHGERPYSMGKMATISITGLAGLFGLLTSK